MVTPPSVMFEESVGNNKNENQDDSIWLKEKWAIGEVWDTFLLVIFEVLFARNVCSFTTFVPAMVHL
jgi:hypothetical protein